MNTIIAGTLAALLTHSGASRTPTPQAGPSVAASVEGIKVTQDLTGRIFDLRGLSLAAPLDPFTARTSVLLPLLQSVTNDIGDGGVVEATNSGFEGFPTEALVEAFMETSQEGAEFETVEVLDNGLVYLVGQSQVLEQFDAFIGRIGAALMSNPTLEILEFRVREENALALPEGVRLSGRTERARLREWLSNGVPFSERQVLLAGGGIHTVSDLESHTVTASFRAEIAATSAVFKPQVFDAVVGSELTLSGYRRGDGVFLQYMAKSTEFHEVESRRTYGVESRVFSEESRSYTSASETWSEDFCMAGGHSVGSAEIDANHYLMLSVGASQGYLRCIAISLDSNSLKQPSVSRIKGSGQSDVVAVPWGLMQPAQLELNWSSYRRMSHLEHYASAGLEPSEGTLQAVARLQDTSLFHYMLEDGEGYSDYYLPGQVLLVVDKSDADRMEKWATLETPGTTYHVSVISQDATGTQRQRGSVSIEAGTHGALVSGHEYLIAKRTDVEVAQRSATSVPVPTTHFDGLALTMQLGTAPDGTLLYGLRGQMSTDLAVTDSSTKLGTDSALTAVTASHLFIQETGTAAPADEPGTWTILVGDETRGGAFVELTVSAQ